MTQIQNDPSMFPANVIKTNEQRLQAMLVVAHQQYNSGKYKDAIVTCQTVYNIDAYRTDNLLLLGACHFQMRNFSECIFYNQQCIRINPNFAEAYSNLGNSLRELGDLTAAVQFYLKAIKLKPRFCDAYNNLASTHMQLGQIKQAVETYQMALVLNPKLVDAHSNLGNLYKAQGRLQAAKKCYLEAIKIRPDFAIAWSNLAGVFKEEGQISTAISYYKEAIKLCPEFADAYSNLGNAYKEDNELELAKECYTMAIKLRPDFAIAHGNLASCYYDLGQISDAISTFKYSIQLEPNFPDAYNNLGNALRETNRLEEAVNCYRTALRLKPDHPHAYNNLGNAMKDKGLVKEAIHCYVTAVRLMPKFAAAHSNLGSILKEQGKHEQALAHYHEAIAIDPFFADAYSNLGNAYKDLGRLEDAKKCYTKAIEISPNFADAYSNLASAYKDGNEILEAIVNYRKALEIRPNFPDALANLVHSLVFICDWRSRKLDFQGLQSVLKEQLKSSEDNSSIDESSLSNPNEKPRLRSTSVYNRMIDDNSLPSIQPFHALVYDFSLDQMKQLATKYALRAKANVTLIDLPVFQYRKPLESLPYYHENSRTKNNAFTKELYSSSSSQREQQVSSQSTKTKNEQMAVVAAKQKPPRIKIGYVSSDIGNHPLSHLLQSVFGLHDRDIYDVYIYALTPDDRSEWRASIERDVEHFRDITQLTSGDAARLINADGIDILFNLNGYTKGSRNEIFALRPAPIQVSFMGFCGTMGADYIQYMVADKFVIPDKYREHYTENIINMPFSYFVNDHRQSCRHLSKTTSREGLPANIDYENNLINDKTTTKPLSDDEDDEESASDETDGIKTTTDDNERKENNAGENSATGAGEELNIGEKVPFTPETTGDPSIANGPHTAFGDEILKIKVSRKMYGIPEDKFVYCNFNQLYKIDPEIFDIWCSILKKVHNSVLWLNRFPPAGEENIREEARKRHISDDRIIFTDVVPKEEHILRGTLADLFLDTPNCNAHTTGCDILWSGTPMLTCPGEKMASRVGGSLLNACGLQDLICETLWEYEKLAVDLAIHPDKLLDYRLKLEELKDFHPLFDTPRWVKSFEGGLMKVYENYQKKLLLQDIDAPECLITKFDSMTPIKLSENTAALYKEVHRSVLVSKRENEKKEVQASEAALHSEVHPTVQAVMSRRADQKFVLGDNEIIADKKTLIR